jgi:hypothetical protein
MGCACKTSLEARETFALQCMAITLRSVLGKFVQHGKKLHRRNSQGM